MDKFYKKNNCDRCGKPLTIRTMSMFNTDCICMECKHKETLLPEYDNAVKAVQDAMKNGDTNFKGIGLPKEDK